MKSIKVIIVILVIFLTSSCREDENIERDYPSLETLHVTYLPIKHGITLNAKIISGNLSHIVEYGFLWSTNKLLDIDHSERVIMLDQIEDGYFSADIIGAFREHESYYVSAFLRTEKYLIYGQVIKFWPKYGKKAIIDYFHPTYGTWGDTIKIVGKNFGYIPDEIKVRFGNVRSVVFSFSDTLLFTTVPAVKNNHMVSLGVSAGWSAATADVAFEYLIPEVFEITPTHGGILDTISIIGKNLGRKKEYSTVKFNKLDAEIIYASDTLIQALVPAELNTLTSQIKIISIGFDVQFTETFTLNPPASIWMRKNDFPGTARGNAVAFSIGNIGYIGTGIIDPSFNVTNDFWKYDPEQDTWEQIASLPGDARGKAVAFSINDHAYVGLGNNKHIFYNDFYKYYPANDTWEQLADFPGTPRHSSACFVIKDEAWIGTGYTSHQTITSEYYKFNATDNTWTQENNFPRNTGSAVGFSIDNSGYVYDYNALFKLVSGNWVQLTAPTLNALNNNAFTINEMAYFGLGKNSQGLITVLQEYDPVAHTYSNKPPLPAGERRSGVAVFTINSIAYIVGGSYSSAFWNSVWEFDPTKPEN